MFDIGLQEMLVIGVLALLVFGPSKLPELGRMVGRAMREFRRASDEFRSTVETNLHMNDLETIAPPPGETVSQSDTTPSETLPSEREPAVGLVGTESATLEPASTTATPESAEPFCARRDSRLFHRRACTWNARIPEIERVYFKSVADARDQGFLTCPVCEPWEPA